MKDFMKMMSSMNEDSQGEEMSPEKHQAKMETIQELIEALSKMAGEKVQDRMKKVTVTSDSPEGLEKGLAKAQEMLGQEPMQEAMSDEEPSEEPESEEMPEEEAPEEQPQEEKPEEEEEEDDLYSMFQKKKKSSY